MLAESRVWQWAWPLFTESHSQPHLCVVIISAYQTIKGWFCVYNLICGKAWGLLITAKNFLSQTSANFINQLDTNMNQIRSDIEHFQILKKMHTNVFMVNLNKEKKKHLSAPSFPVNNPLHNLFRNGIHACYWLHFNYVPEWKKCSKHCIFLFLPSTFFIYFCRVWRIRPQASNMRRLHGHTIMELKWN